MPLTKEQIRDRIAERLKLEARGIITAQDILTALTNMTAPERQQYLSAVNDENAERIGRLTIRAIYKKIEEDKKAEADTILADDQMSLAEIERVFFS